MVVYLIRRLRRFLGSLWGAPARQACPPADLEPAMGVVRLVWHAAGWLSPERLVLDYPSYEVALNTVKLPTAQEVMLRTPGAREAARNALNDLELLSPLTETLRQEAPTCILFDMGSGPASFPWELISEFLPSERARKVYVPARVLGARTQPRAHRIAEQMRILIVLGDRGDPFNPIDPQREADDVLAAWEALDPRFQSKIARPNVARLSDLEVNGRCNLSSALTREPIHVLWYCGHGRAQPQPGWRRPC